MFPCLIRGLLLSPSLERLVQTSHPGFLPSLSRAQRFLMMPRAGEELLSQFRGTGFQLPSRTISLTNHMLESQFAVSSIFRFNSHLLSIQGSQSFAFAPEFLPFANFSCHLLIFFGGPAAVSSFACSTSSNVSSIDATEHMEGTGI